MAELVVHAADPANRGRVLCGQIKMRDGSPRAGLRFSYERPDVTCSKCREALRGLPRPVAIETSYAGCRFRSRLEARWAVFFDVIGIPWEYEAQGFLVGGDRPYLPDFYLPTVWVVDQNPELPESPGVWVEVKGGSDLVDAGYVGMLGEAIDYRATSISSGLLLLGPVPNVTPPWLPTHNLLTWWEGVHSGWIAFSHAVDGDHWGLLPIQGAPTHLAGWAGDTQASWESGVATRTWTSTDYELTDAYRTARSERFGR